MFTKFREGGQIPSIDSLGLSALARKNCILLPAVSKQSATFSSNFTQHGKSLLVQPCRGRGRPLPLGVTPARCRERVWIREKGRKVGGRRKRKKINRAILLSGQRIARRRRRKGRTMQGAAVTEQNLRPLCIDVGRWDRPVRARGS